MISFPSAPLEDDRVGVLVPSTGTFWDLDSTSDFESEHDDEDEVEEILLPAEDIRAAFDLRQGQGRSLSDAYSDTLRGAATWRSCPEDDASSLYAPTPSSSRSHSLRNPFRSNSSSKFSARSRCESRASCMAGSASVSEQAFAPPKRRRSLSGVIAPLLSISPRMRAASPSPIKRTISILRSSFAPHSRGSKRPESEDVKAKDNIRAAQLEKAAAAAEWQTSIEHRPQLQRSLSSVSATSWTANLLSSAIPGRLDDLPNSSLSPALMRGLCQSTSDASTIQMLPQSQLLHATVRKGLAPPRPTKSVRRAIHRPLADVPVDLQTDEKVDNSLPGYPESNGDDTHSDNMSTISSRITSSSSLSSGSHRIIRRRDCASPSPYWNPPRRSSTTASSSSSSDEMNESSGMSQSSCTSNSSTPSVPQNFEEKLRLASLVREDPMVFLSDQIVVSPFTMPREVPLPPRASDNSGEGCRYISRPTCTRQDSSLDPYLTGDLRSYRPTSATLSPPSIYVHNTLASSASDGDKVAKNDDLLFALDHLESNLEPQVSHKMKGYFECPSDHRLTKSKHHTSMAPQEVSGWQRYADSDLFPSSREDALDRDALYFLQSYT